MLIDDVLKKTNELLKTENKESGMSTSSSTSSSSSSLLSKSKSKGTGAYLSEDVEFKGTLYFNSRAELNGKLEGEIIADGALIIGDAAIIKGNINCASSVELRGKVQGNVRAVDRVELSGNAHLYGDIQSPKITVGDNVTFVGRSDTLQGKSPTADFSKIFSQLDKSGSASSGKPTSS